MGSVALCDHGWPQEICPRCIDPAAVPHGHVQEIRCVDPVAVSGEQGPEDPWHRWTVVVPSNDVQCRALGELLEERRHQDRKHGLPQVTDSDRTLLVWLAILVEEVAELAEEIRLREQAPGPVWSEPLVESVAQAGRVARKLLQARFGGDNLEGSPPDGEVRKETVQVGAVALSMLEWMETELNL